MIWRRAVLVASPAVLLAALGVTHPNELSASTAAWWTTLHLLMLPLFPLLAVSLWVLLRDVEGPIAWIARIAAYGFAVFYTGLDLLAGVGAGSVVQGGGLAPEVLFRVGNDLGAIGVWCFLIGCAATGAALTTRYGRRAVPGAVLLLVGALPFMSNHVYWPAGGAALLAIAAACALLAGAEQAPAPIQEAPALT